MDQICCVIMVFSSFLLESSGTKANAKYQVALDNFTDCNDPQPPFTDKRIALFYMSLYKGKKKTYVSGTNKILQEIPFVNYSATSFNINPSGSREQVYKIENLNCRSYMGKIFLLLGNFRYNSSNCRLLKSTSVYNDFDIDKIAHKMLIWHYEGTMMHRVQLVASKRTVFCLEVFVSIKTIK